MLKQVIDKTKGIGRQVANFFREWGLVSLAVLLFAGLVWIGRWWSVEWTMTPVIVWPLGSSVHFPGW